MRADEYLALDALGLAERLRKKEVSPAEVLAAAEARCDAVNPKINAVIHRFAATAIGELPAEPSAAPFWGVPFLVKDLDGTLANAPFCGGSRALRDYPAPTDSDLFRRYKEIGLAIFGKTNTPEFGIVAFTEPELFGATKNPWNLEHTPGGSSGGSAAAVAAGIVPVAHAGDGGGSIRIPASACGLFGLKPTRGRMPLGPVGEGWNGLVVPHVVSRTVRDSAAFLDATWADPKRGDVGAPYGPPPAPYPGNFLAAVTKVPRRLRIGFTSQSIFGKDTHADCTHALGEAMRACEALGHDVFPTTLPLPAHGLHGRDALRRAYLVIVAAGVSAAVRETTHRAEGRRGEFRAGDLVPPPTRRGALGGRSRRGARHDVRGDTGGFWFIFNTFCADGRHLRSARNADARPPTGPRRRVGAQAGRAGRARASPAGPGACPP